jgi:hypothetical protein
MVRLHMVPLARPTTTRPGVVSVLPCLMCMCVFSTAPHFAQQTCPRTFSMSYATKYVRH